MADKHTCLTEEKLSAIIRTIFYEKLQKQEQSLLNILRNVEVDVCHLKENLFAQSTLLTNQLANVRLFPKLFYNS